jgi:hypothetical protein
MAKSKKPESYRPEMKEPDPVKFHWETGDVKEVWPEVGVAADPTSAEDEDAGPT